MSGLEPLPVMGDGSASLADDVLRLLFLFCFLSSAILTASLGCLLVLFVVVIGVPASRACCVFEQTTDTTQALRPHPWFFRFCDVLHVVLDAVPGPATQVCIPSVRGSGRRLLVFVML